MAETQVTMEIKTTTFSHRMA